MPFPRYACGPARASSLIRTAKTPRSRKLQQGSQQTQGEVLELELEELLRAAFPFDQIEPVPKGINGADLIHRVHNKNGHCCGTIVWESKRTKGWSDGWIQKLKDDLRLTKGDIAVIVSEALPKEIDNFAQVKGVWITGRSCALSLAAALRCGDAGGPSGRATGG